MAVYGKPSGLPTDVGNRSRDPPIPEPLLLLKLTQIPKPKEFSARLPPLLQAHPSIGKGCHCFIRHRILWIAGVPGEGQSPKTERNLIEYQYSVNFCMALS
jgi:hypothetical protein